MNEQHDLDWVAFQYIADELPPDEATAFELRLADDQAAREAVAQAVELSQAAAAALDVQPSIQLAPQAAQPAGRAWSGALWWMSCGAAACLAAVVGYQAWQAGHEAPALAPSPELARAWTETRGQQLEASPELEQLSGVSDADEIAAAGDPDSLESGADGAPPSWIVAALSGDEEPKGPASMEEEMMNTTPGKKGEG